MRIVIYLVTPNDITCCVFYSCPLNFNIFGNTCGNFNASNVRRCGRSTVKSRRYRIKVGSSNQRTTINKGNLIYCWNNISTRRDNGFCFGSTCSQGNLGSFNHLLWGQVSITIVSNTIDTFSPIDAFNTIDKIGYIITPIIRINPTTTKVKYLSRIRIGNNLIKYGFLEATGKPATNINVIHHRAKLVR